MKKPKTTVAIVRAKGQGNNSFVEVISIGEDSHGDTMVTDRYTLPKYDMSKITVSKPRFQLDDMDDDIYRAILATKEGTLVLDVLKNEKTDKIINEHIKRECGVGESFVQIEGHHNGLDFLMSVTKEPLTERNLLPHKAIGLRKEQIWNRFKESGLVDKYKSIKK